MTDVPAETPVTIPVVDPTVATGKRLLLQVPPGVGSLRVVVLPSHTNVVPVIADGDGLHVMVVVTIHAPPNE